MIGSPLLDTSAVLLSLTWRLVVALITSVIPSERQKSKRGVDGLCFGFLELHGATMVSPRVQSHEVALLRAQEANMVPAGELVGTG